VQVFWPTDVVNDHIKVKDADLGELWLKFKDAKSKEQVVLLEDFVIPQVKIKDSRLVVISQDDRSQPEEEPPVLISKEEVVPLLVDLDGKEEPQQDQEDKNPENKSDTDAEPLQVDLFPPENDSDTSAVDPVADAPSLDVSLEDPEQKDAVDEEGDVEPVARPINSTPISDLAPGESLRPVMPTRDRPKSRPPMSDAQGLSFFLPALSTWRRVLHPLGVIENLSCRVNSQTF